MGGSSGGGGGTNVIRYRPNLEVTHDTLLLHSQGYGDILRDDSPYDDFEYKDFTSGLYGTGYTTSSFPSLYDMFGKFGAGLDIESLFSQVLTGIQDMDAIQSASTSHNDLLTDEIEQDVLPRFQLGMRDANAVMSSTFIIGKGIIESARIKKVAEFDAELKYKLIPVAAEVFAQHLKWNQAIIGQYLEILRFAITIEFDTDNHNYLFKVKNHLWPFSVLALERANIAALNGGGGGGGGGSVAEEASTGSKVMSGVVGGAMIGTKINAGWGTAIGAVVGGIAGYFS